MKQRTFEMVDDERGLLTCDMRRAADEVVEAGRMVVIRGVLDSRWDPHIDTIGAKVTAICWATHTVEFEPFGTLKELIDSGVDLTLKIRLKRGKVFCFQSTLEM